MKLLNQREFLQLCTRGKREEIEEAIRHGASINRRANYNGTTVPPLFVAVMEGNFEAIEVLMKHKAKPIYGFLAAILIDNKFMADYLISLGANINCQDIHKRTPLLCAVTANKPKAVKWLIELGADVNLKVADGYNALTYAAFMFEDRDMPQPSTEIIKFLMKAGSNYDDAMLVAIKMNSTFLASLLIENGADVNKKCTLTQSPLSVAILNIKNDKKDWAMVEFLTANNADVNEIIDLGDGFTSTNLNVCISVNSPRAADVLLRYGANPDFRDTRGRTALMYSVLTNAEILNVILTHGANPDIQDNEGRTALMLAVIDGNNEDGIIETLLENGANPDIQDKNGLTALMWAIIDRDRSPEILISALIRTGGLHTEGGALWFATAVFFAAAKREAQLDIIRILINNGANLEIRNKKGMNAFMCAMLNDDDEIIQILNSVRS